MATETKNLKATVDIGEALTEIDKLRKKAEDLKKAYNEAQMQGDTKAMKNIQKEIKATEKQTKEFQRSLSSVDSVLQRLDRSTLKELQTALRQAQKELKNARRGTEEFASASQKVKKLETALQQVRREAGLANKAFGGSLLDKLKGGFTALLGPVGMVASAFYAIQKAVGRATEAVAKMDAAMTDARQYTGMTTAEIRLLNEEFQKMDTKTSREQLNQLAADAGRLGKNTVEDVLGYVRAANMVNIALKDLGDDATLTLTKLAGVFGVEAEKGTEQALLSVGSAITEMANSCAASAGGVAEFTSRIGGAGSAAGLTLPQITAMGAVFENAGTSVEKSSTAMQKLISDLAVNTEKIAKAAGIKDIERFSKLVKTDMNEALLLLFSTLKQNGSFANLAPIFAEMGEKGSGVIQTLTTMANNVDFLRQQQERATVAFNEATAVVDAYNIQNNTVEAQLERNKKALNEVWVTLGEQLKPLIADSVGWLSKVVAGISTTVSAISGIITYLRIASTETGIWGDALRGAVDFIKWTWSWTTKLAQAVKWVNDYFKELNGVENTRKEFAETEQKITDLLAGSNANIKRLWQEGNLDLLLQEQAELAGGAGKAERKKYKELEKLISRYKALQELLREIDTETNDPTTPTPQPSLAVDTTDDPKPKQQPSLAVNPATDGTDAIKARLAELKAQYEDQKLQYKQMLVDESLTQQEYLDKMKQAEIDHLAQVALLYVEGTQEQDDAERKHCEAVLNYQLWLRQEEQKLQDEKDKEAEKRRQEEENRKKDEEKQRQEDAERLLEEEARLAEERKKQQEQVVQAMFSTFSQALSSASQYISASMEADVARVTAEYDKQIENAQGNKALQEQLEQEKQKKIAGIKAKANKKQTTIQIMQAIASTAQAAIEAYKSMAAIPIVGPALGAAAAAAAVAFGGVQIATIKKQAAAQEATGFAHGGFVGDKKDYATGGYTRNGQKYEPAGIVHAGEYVVPQELVADPDTAPLVRALEAVRQNRITYRGATSAQATGAQATPTATTAQSGQTAPPATSAQSGQNTPAATNEQEFASLIQQLNNRLQQPLVAQVTVSGDHGIQQAWEEYNRYVDRATK